MSAAARPLAILAVLALLAPAAASLPLLDEAPPTETVRIDRDAYGVPHVYADTAYGIFWGNGYAQAQDRLFQMDVLRHVGKGESAAYLGPSQLAMDLETRRELYTDAERTARWQALPQDLKDMFQGYADGVNAWIEETRQDPTKLSAEFYAIGHEPELWVAEDTIAIAEYLLDIFGAGSGGNELRNAQLLWHLKTTMGDAAAEDAFDDFFWTHDEETYVSVPEDEYTYASTESPLDFADIPALQWEVIEAAAGAVPFAQGETLDDVATGILGDFKFGSNALVASPALAESGNAILLGGPQMAYYNPMVPYEVALHGAGFDAVGMGVGGAPGVIIGRNANLAWTVTSGSSDQVDVVAVKLVDDDPRAYYVSGKAGATKAMECRTEIHYGPPTAIDQNPPVLATQEVCRTERGPVFAINEEMGYAFVRERTHRLDELRSGILWLTLAQNEDLASFQQHMETFCFEFNFHVAAKTGDIAYLHFGCQPVRASGYDPRFPRLAGEWDWTDVRSGSELPYIINPDKEYIVNWNNKPARGWSGGDAMEKWGPVHRAELFERAVQAELAEDGSLNVQDLEDINVYISTRSPFPFYFIDDIQSALDDRIARLAPLDPDAAADFAAMRDAMDQWQAADFTWEHATDAAGVDRYVHPGFAIYETWRGHMQELTFRDELGPFMRELGFIPAESSDPHAADHGREDNKDNVLYNALHGRATHAWFDVVDSDGTETAADIIDTALRMTFDDLSATYGSTDAADWRQPIHHIKFVALSGSPGWEIPMVNRPSFNHLYDWGTGHAASVMPPGSNQYWMPADFIRYNLDGTMPDPHKRDQLDLYVDFEYKPAQLTPSPLSSSHTYEVEV